MTLLGRRIRDLIKIEKPNLLHVHSPVLNAIPALCLGRRLGIPVVYEIRAFWEDAAVDHGSYRQYSWKYVLTRSIETWVCRKAAHVVVLCNGLKKDLLNRGIKEKKISVVPNGVNLDDFRPCEPDSEYIKLWELAGKRVIGFIGSFYRYEGLDLLIDAFASLVRVNPDIVLLLAGGGKQETQLKALKRRLQLGKKIIIPGRIPHNRIAGIYAITDILGYPRYSHRLTELVTPLKPLEAMAMGKAVVASDVGGHRELIRDGHTGILFPAGNVSALAEALHRLLNDDVLRKRLEEQSSFWVRQERSWGKTTGIYADIYAKAFDCRTKATKNACTLK
jgi:PEP-CTERM/exosortase A-associated glycosyltransferase